MKLFGLFSLKDIEVDVSDTKYAVPCGPPIGIYMKSDGLMVIGTGEVTTKNGDIIDPADGVLKSGDYIEANQRCPGGQQEGHDSGRQQLRRRRSDAFREERRGRDACGDDACGNGRW